MCCPSRLVHKLLKWNINHLSSWVSTLLLHWRHCCFEEHDGIMGKLKSLWVPVTCRSWKAEFCKLRMHCSLSSEVWLTLESCSYCSGGRLHSTSRPPLPFLPASTGNEVKEFNLDLPLFWLHWRRHAARLDAAAVFSPISKSSAKVQTETGRKSGTDATQMSAMGRLYPSSHCAQPGRWHDAVSPVAQAEECQYRHVHVCTCTHTCVHAYTLVSFAAWPCSFL